MGCLGNAIWFLCGGLSSALGWCFAGLLWCVTIVGIPVGVQCFKLAGVALFPFGKNVQYSGSAGSTLLNILWILFGGLALAIGSWLSGAFLCITIIGIPFGKQHFKLAKLALMPFGAVVS